MPRLTLLSPAPRLVSLSGHVLETIGMTHMRIGGVNSRVVVVEQLSPDLLIGADLLRMCVLDFPRRVCIIGDQHFPMDTTPETSHASCGVSHFLPKASLPVLQEVLEAYKDVFSSKETPVQKSTVPPAHIVTEGPPIRQRQYRIPLAKKELVKTCVDEMLRDGIIRPSDSPWAAPITLVPKKDGSTRFCADFRRLNLVTRKNSHPLPHIQDIFDQLGGSTIFSTLDLKAGYWQIPMAEDSISKTAFTCHLGLYEFTRLPFGLTNAPAIFQRAMTKVLSGLIGKTCMCYIDDIVIYSKTPEEHAKHLQQVLERLRQAGLQLKPSKCKFGLSELELLGFMVSGQGIRPLPEKVKAIRNLDHPKDVREVRSFLGMVNYYRQAIPGFATLALPLTQLTQARQPFIWGEEQQRSFDRLKEALTTEPILAHPDPTRPYVLYTDASQHTVGAILVQKDQSGMERVIAYLSHKLSGSQLHWPIIEKEAFAVVFSLKKFHPYLWGSTFEIHTDHKPLKSLFTSEIRNTKLQRWAIQIAEYGAPILYHPGVLNVRPDMLSRIASVQEVPETVFETPTQTPTAWETDHIDLETLRKYQTEQFAEQIAEAEADIDNTPFVMESGVVYSLAPPYKGASAYLRAVLPQQFRQQVIDRCHVDTGHSAFVKTLLRVQENYVWPGMRKHVREYISTCVQCHTMAPPPEQTVRGHMPTPPRPFHTWGLDLVGPFRRDKKGRQYLMTCVDHLTGWCEAIPIRSKVNTGIAEAFMTDIVARYGIPSVITTDNGGEFVASSFRKWLAEAGIDHRLTNPYHPQCNGKVERFNGTIQTMLRKLTGGDPKKWSTCLPDALYAYRITATPCGLSPYELTYGQRPRLPRSPVSAELPGERLRNVHRAREVILAYQEAQKTKYQNAQPARAMQYHPGMYVAVRILNPKKGESKWRPGYQVLDARGPALKLRHPIDRKIIRVNQNNVRHIPQQLEYEEVDPVPLRPVQKETYPEVAPPVQVDPPTLSLHPPIAFAAACDAEWIDWCETVYHMTHA